MHMVVVYSTSLDYRADPCEQLIGPFPCKGRAEHWAKEAGYLEGAYGAYETKSPEGVVSDAQLLAEANEIIARQSQWIARAYDYIQTCKVSDPYDYTRGRSLMAEARGLKT